MSTVILASLIICKRFNRFWDLSRVSAQAWHYREGEGASSPLKKKKGRKEWEKREEKGKMYRFKVVLILSCGP